MMAEFDRSIVLMPRDRQDRRPVPGPVSTATRRPGGQSQFSRFLAYQATDPGPIRDVQSWALDHLDADLGVDALANRAAMSPRNFARVFVQQTGVTPSEYRDRFARA